MDQRIESKSLNEVNCLRREINTGEAGGIFHPRPCLVHDGKITMLEQVESCGSSTRFRYKAFILGLSRYLPLRSACRGIQPLSVFPSPYR